MTTTEKAGPVGTLRVDSGIFQKVSRTVLHAVSTDTDRAHLNSLHIVSSADRLIVEGTDGICMAIWEIEGDFTAFDIMVPRDRVAAFLRALPKPSEQKELFEDGYVRIRDGVLEGSGVRIEFARPAASFPDLGAVTPQRHKGLAPPFMLHPLYLKRAAEVFESASKRGCVPLIEGGPTAEAAIRFSSPEAQGLLFIAMPLQPDEDDDAGPAPRQRLVSEVSDAVTEAAAALVDSATKDGATTTISAGGKSVTLTPEMGKKLREAGKKLGAGKKDRKS